MAAYERWNLRVSTGRLNRWLKAMARHHPPPTVKGKPLNVKYATQVKSRPPTFAVFVNRPNDVPESYQRCVGNASLSTCDYVAWLSVSNVACER